MQGLGRAVSGHGATRWLLEVEGSRQASQGPGSGRRMRRLQRQHHGGRAWPLGRGGPWVVSEWRPGPCARGFQKVTLIVVAERGTLTREPFGGFFRRTVGKAGRDGNIPLETLGRGRGRRGLRCQVLRLPPAESPCRVVCAVVFRRHTVSLSPCSWEERGESSPGLPVQLLLPSRLWPLLKDPRLGFPGWGLQRRDNRLAPRAVESGSPTSPQRPPTLLSVTSCNTPPLGMGQSWPLTAHARTLAKATSCPLWGGLHHDRDLRRVLSVWLFL